VGAYQQEVERAGASSCANVEENLDIPPSRHTAEGGVKSVRPRTPADFEPLPGDGAVLHHDANP
jgi:hypothetical protein